MIFHRGRSAAFLGRVFPFVGALLLIAPRINAQSLEELFPGLRDRAIIFEIAARIIEQNGDVVWNVEDSKITLPGRPVGLRLDGPNIRAGVLFTPIFNNASQNLLLAQGQVFLNIPGRGVVRYTIFQTIPLEYGEMVYFFPLGSKDVQKEDTRIEIQLVLHPYAEKSQNPETPKIEETPVPQ